MNKHILGLLWSGVHDSAVSVVSRDGRILMAVEEERLSRHSLRHSYASSRDAGFTLRVYAKDARDEATFVSDVLNRAASAGIGQ